jgi:hypothetical protein
MLLVLLALPFCVIAIPGLSTPFGIAICVMGGSLHLCFRDCRFPVVPGFFSGADLARKSLHRSEIL